MNDTSHFSYFLMMACNRRKSQVSNNNFQHFLSASIYPSLVNVHVNHPPEATVQIHQVARVKSDSEQSEENSVESVQIPQLPVASHYNNNVTPNNNVVIESNQQQRSQGFMGKCYLESVHGKVRNNSVFLVLYEHKVLPRCSRCSFNLCNLMSLSW